MTVLICISALKEMREFVNELFRLPRLIYLCYYEQACSIQKRNNQAYCNKRSDGTKPAMLEAKLIIIPAIEH